MTMVRRVSCYTYSSSVVVLYVRIEVDVIIRRRRPGKYPWDQSVSFTWSEGFCIHTKHVKLGHSRSPTILLLATLHQTCMRMRCWIEGGAPEGVSGDAPDYSRETGQWQWLLTSQSS